MRRLARLLAALKGGPSIDEQALEATEGDTSHTPWFFPNGETILSRDAEWFPDLIEVQL
jgi:hypothetical protein